MMKWLTRRQPRLQRPSTWTRKYSRWHSCVKISHLRLLKKEKKRRNFEIRSAPLLLLIFFRDFPTDQTLANSHFRFLLKTRVLFEVCLYVTRVDSFFACWNTKSSLLPFWYSAYYIFFSFFPCAGVFPQTRLMDNRWLFASELEQDHRL